MPFSFRDSSKSLPVKPAPLSETRVSGRPNLANKALDIEWQWRTTKACLFIPMGAAELSSVLVDLTGSQSNAILLILYFHPALAAKQTSELNSSYVTLLDDHCATLQGSVFDLGRVQPHKFPAINNHNAQTTLLNANGHNRNESRLVHFLI